MGWSDGSYASPAGYDAELSRIEESHRRGKHTILVGQGTEGNDSRQLFGLASYLLVADSKASFRYAAHADYSAVWLYPNYRVELGSPLGPRYADGDTWRRDFTGGTVSVNPVTESAAIELG
jgi:hypothetical protein